MKSGVYQGTGAGVTPKDTAEERVNREYQGEGSTYRAVNERRI